MNTTVQARLDEETQEALDRLVRRLGWSPSKVVRESLRLMIKHHGAASRRKVIGVDEFDSGTTDLGSNKAHLEGYGG
jgi:predicted transcriptional regulator